VEIVLKDAAYGIIGANGYRLGLVVSFGAHGKLEHEGIGRKAIMNSLIH
jgi:hypothetical protein